MSLIFLRFTVSYVAEKIRLQILKTFSFLFLERSLEAQFLVMKFAYKRRMQAPKENA